MDEGSGRRREMTNARQMIPGMENRTRDEVQLTELLPVRGSRIRQNGDGNVADAFKALREGNKNSFNPEMYHFAHGKNGDAASSQIGNDFDGDQGLDANEYDLLELKDCDQRGTDLGKRQATARVEDRGRNSTNANLFSRQNVIKEDGIVSNEGKIADVKKTRKKKMKKKMKYRKDEENNALPDENEDKEDPLKKSGLSYEARKNEALDKSLCRGEVFVYRPDNRKDVPENINRLENSSYTSIDTIEEERNNAYYIDSKNDPYRNSGALETASEDTNLNASSPKSLVPQPGNKNRPNEVLTIGTSLAEENLRRRIDAIIQANFLIERENNNVVRRNNNKIQSIIGDAAASGDSLDPDFLLKKYHCVVCSARFKGSGGLRTHYRVVHGTGPIFTCHECGKEFPLKERLKLHVRTHTGYKPYSCGDCGKTFARGGQLVQHRRTHTRVKPYQCDLCPGQFSCAANLALHVKRHNGQKDHKCEICSRAFVRRDALKKHLECLHKDVKSFLCVICNKTFKGHLPQHMRTHAQDRPHGCGTCGQRFAQKSQLTVHQRTHSGQRPFRCLVCWQAFAHSTALKLHTRRHTGERPFKCAECNAGFTQLPHWKKHMRCVHGRLDPYRCKNCNSFFRIKNDLENHEKTCRLAERMVDRQVVERTLPKFRVMTVEKMRLLLAVLLKRISKPERLDELGFGKRLIDEVLKDSLVSAGREPAKPEGLNEFEVLRLNLGAFLEWTVPRAHWDAFRKMNKTPEEILETLTAT